MSGPTTIDELIDIMSEQRDGECRVGRTISEFIVPGKALDSTVVNVALSKLSEQPMHPSAYYNPTTLEPGRYEITVLIHVKRVGDINNLLN